MTQPRLRDNGQWGSLNHSVMTGRGARERVLGCYKPTAAMHTTGAEPRTESGQSPGPQEWPGGRDKGTFRIKGSQGG